MSCRDVAISLGEGPIFFDIIKTLNLFGIEINKPFHLNRPGDDPQDA
jgi:hypothetical protein